MWTVSTYYDLIFLRSWHNMGSNPFRPSTITIVERSITQRILKQRKRGILFGLHVMIIYATVQTLTVEPHGAPDVLPNILSANQTRSATGRSNHHQLQVTNSVNVLITKLLKCRHRKLKVLSLSYTVLFVSFFQLILCTVCC
jgi:hypothetical protein